MISQGYQVTQDGAGQVLDRGFNSAHVGMGEGFPWLPHGDDMDGKSQGFQKQNFIGDKGFRYPWIAFQNHT